MGKFYIINGKIDSDKEVNPQYVINVTNPSKFIQFFYSATVQT